MHFFSHSKVNITLSLIIVFAACLTLLFSPRFVTRAAASPHITLSQKSGPPTSIVKVNGTNFGASEMVSVTFDTTQLATITTSTTGAFSLNLSIPASARPGNHTIQAIGQSSGSAAQATFFVQTNWAMFGFGPEHRGVNALENVLTTSAVSGLAPDWSYATGDVNTSVAVVNGIVYVCSDDHKLYALDAVTGEFKWRYVTKGAVCSTPAVVNGIVYIGSTDASLYALNATTGRLKWRYVTGGSLSSPTVLNGIVYVGSADHKLYALDAITGARKWSYTTGGSISSSPAVANGVVYIGSADASLYALNATTGRLKWSYVTGGAIDSSPAVGATGLVYVGDNLSFAGPSLLYALNIVTGTLKWSYSADGCAIEVAPAVANGMVYFATDGDLAGWVCQSFNNLLAVNATSGALVWSTFRGGPNGTTNSAPIIANGVLYISTEGFDHEADCSFSMGWAAYNATTGSGLWGNGPSNTCYTYGPPATPIVVNGVFYSGSAVGDNTFYTFHLPGMTP